MFVAVAGCGGDDVADELGQLTCAEMQAELEELTKTLEGEVTDLALYRYVAARAELPVETVIPYEENEGWSTWFQYYCSEDETQTAAESFGRAEEIVTESGGPAAAQERWERVIDFQEPPPP